MNRTLRTIALAAPLATVAFSIGVSPALAEPAGPAIDTITSAPQVDPDPEPQPEPDGPEIPDDKVSIPDPCPTHGSCGEDTPDDKKGPNDEGDPGDDDSSTGDEFEKPTRIDAGAATNGASGTGDDLAWLLTGGVLIARTGAAYAARRRERAELADLDA